MCSVVSNSLLPFSVYGIFSQNKVISFEPRIKPVSLASGRFFPSHLEALMNSRPISILNKYIYKIKRNQQQSFSW